MALFWRALHAFPECRFPRPFRDGLKPMLVRLVARFSRQTVLDSETTTCNSLSVMLGSGMLLRRCRPKAGFGTVRHSSRRCVKRFPDVVGSRSRIAGMDSLLSPRCRATRDHVKTCFVSQAGCEWECLFSLVFFLHCRLNINKYANSVGMRGRNDASGDA